MKLESLWIILLAINVFLFLGQISADNLELGGVDLYSYNGSLMQSRDSGGYIIQQNDTGDLLPSLGGSVSADSGGVFTDTWNAIKGWFTNTLGGQFITTLFYGVPNLLNGLGLDPIFVFAIGFFWTMMVLISFILFLRG